jgi:uncharacterized membrane protein
LSISADSQTAKPRLTRILLIDTLRGLALIAMASYHFTWDLEFFGYLDPGMATQGLFRIYARTIASSFLFLAGVSLVLAHGMHIRWPSFCKRLAVVAGAALAISIATLVAFPNEWIYFGILHNIALSSLIGLAFLRLPLAVAVAVPMVIVAGMVVDAGILPNVLHSSAFDTRWLSWLGFADTPPRSNDYVPLFPWLAALLAGVAVARIGLRRGWAASLSSIQTRDTLLSKGGRHSLIIYLVHQPILIALVYLASLVVPPPAPDPRAGYILSCNASCLNETSDQALCQSFCTCTADRLIADQLMTPLQTGVVGPQDDRVRIIAEECSIPTPAP